MNTSHFPWLPSGSHFWFLHLWYQQLWCQFHFKRVSTSLSTSRLILGVICIILNQFYHLTVVWFMDCPHVMVWSPIVSFLVNVFGLRISIFGIFKFTFVLWTFLPILVDLGLAFDIEFYWKWMISTSFFFWGDLFTDFDTFMFSNLSCSTTVVRDAICYCSGQVLFHFTEASRTLYFLISVVISCYGLMSYPSSYS